MWATPAPADSPWWRAFDQWPSPEVHLEPRGTEQRITTSDGRRLQRLARQRCWCGRKRYAACPGGIHEHAELRLLGLA